MYNIVTKNNDHLIDLQLNILFLFKKTHLPFFIWLTDVFYFILQWLVKTNNSTSVICLYVDRFINLNSIAGVLSWFKENRICHHLEKKKKKEHSENDATFKPLSGLQHTKYFHNSLPSFPLPLFPPVTRGVLSYYFSTLFNYSAAVFSSGHVQFVAKSSQCCFPVMIWKQGRLAAGA